ncbi:ribonuclease P protein component [Fuscovulum blasticum]|uniref:ribonuclease P protein component n=1 Tax=Fuscovulum blasticum TaxID=1075 RepID=UPI000D3E5FA4|nr:ribonuclease P protein component [Fuscovulum blasticum]AWD21632.1 ribonuclease P protein component [Fuscovulum blasticum]
MTPPEAQGTRQPAEAPLAPPAVSVCVMKTRPEFLKAASARRQGAGSFLLQARDRRDGTDKVQIGFTASKKIGNAVARNRAKRRLREVARAVLPRLAQPGWDYVLVARPEATIARPFAALLADLEAALAAVQAPRAPRP